MLAIPTPMKTFPALLTIAALGVAGWFAYSNWLESGAWFGARSAPPLPVERTLTDRTGRTVAVRILARDEDEVQFIRLRDQVMFFHPIASLSDADQAFIRRLPTSALRAPADATRAANAPATISKTAILQRERAELEHAITLLELELEKRNDKSPTLSPDQIQQRIDDCRNRIIDIDKELLDLAFRANTP